MSTQTDAARDVCHDPHHAQERVDTEPQPKSGAEVPADAPHSETTSSAAGGEDDLEEFSLDDIEIIESKVFA